jgi:acetyltransferase
MPRRAKHHRIKQVKESRSPLITHWSLKDGTPVTIRPIRPQDEPLLVKFHHRLSEQSVVLRYFNQLSLSQRTEHERLVRICSNQNPCELALVAEGNIDGEPCILGVGRLSKIPNSSHAEIALLVADPWHHQGLGTHLLELLLQFARDEKIKRLSASILRENVEMCRLVEHFGFVVRDDFTDSTLDAFIDL